MTSVVSLLPSGTEWVYALGREDSLAGVTFECDHPAEARSRHPIVVHGMLTEGMTPGEIDAAVRRSGAPCRPWRTVRVDGVAGSRRRRPRHHRRRAVRVRAVRRRRVRADRARSAAGVVVRGCRLGHRRRGIRHPSRTAGRRRCRDNGARIPPGRSAGAAAGPSRSAPAIGRAPARFDRPAAWWVS
jgi:hypothetical protein